MNVLIVDDFPEDREQLARTLRRCSSAIQVFEAGSLADCELEVQSRARGFFDVFMIDMHMPGVSGIKVAQTIRSSGRADGAVFIMTTGDGSDETRAVALASDFDGFLIKPVNQSRVISMMSDGGVFWQISDLPRNIDLYREMLAQGQDQRAAGHAERSTLADVKIGGA